MFDNRKAILWQPDHPALLPTLGNYRTIKILKQIRDQTEGKVGEGGWGVQSDNGGGGGAYWKYSVGVFF